MSIDLDFYRAPGPMTGLAGISDEFLTSLPDPAAIAIAVQGVVLHPFWAHAYGVAVPAAREGELQLRSATAMVERIIEIDARPLSHMREPAQRIFGNCRHFSVLTAALLRRAGIPSRARCGFASYFEPSRWIDHWVVEYWAAGRWIVLDAQIDTLQREATGIAADPADLPPGLFLSAGAAWNRCRAGLDDADCFGILDMWGKWFIRGNIARDLAALNKVEMLPWDGWGVLCAGADGPAVDDEYVDDIAELTLGNDLAVVRRRYANDDGLRVPTRVMSYATPMGPIETDVDELV